MIRVLVVEDQTLVREGLETLLNVTEDVRVVAHATDGEEALAQMRQHHPDVVLLDVRMPKMSGIDVLRVLHDRKDSAPVILLTILMTTPPCSKAFVSGPKGTC